MKSSRIKTVLSLAVVAMACFALTPATQAATIDVSDPLVPAGLGEGDTFHLAFVTKTATNASIDPPVAPWDDLATFDAIVQTEANTAGIGTSIGVTWKVIGSSATVNANAHAVVTAPVFTVVGNALATGYADMWDGSIANALTHIDGTPLTSATSRWALSWTGSMGDGTASDNPFGDTDRCVSMGNSNMNGEWIRRASNYNQDFSNGCAIYGLSEALTVVPEPATMSLLALGGLGVLLKRRRRRS